jgi:hypothetical protein
MSGKQKVLLVVVAVVLVALFVVAVGGRHPGSGDPNAPNGFAAWLARLGGKQSTVPAELVTADCRQPDRPVFTVNVSCTLHVADPKALKLLVLRSTTPFQVSAPAPGKADYTAGGRVDPKDDGIAEARIAVDKPSDVTVACIGLGPCALTLGDK